MDRYIESNELTTRTNIYIDLLDAYNNTKHSDTIRTQWHKERRLWHSEKEYIWERQANEIWTSWRRRLCQPSFETKDVSRKETDPTYDAELHKVEKNNHDGTYVVDGKLHSGKDLQVVCGKVIP